MLAGGPDPDTARALLPPGGCPRLERLLQVRQLLARVDATAGRDRTAMEITLVDVAAGYLAERQQAYAEQLQAERPPGWPNQELSHQPCVSPWGPRCPAALQRRHRRPHLVGSPPAPGVRCTRSTTEPRKPARAPQVEHEAIRARRRLQETDQRQRHYATRPGRQKHHRPRGGPLRPAQKPLHRPEQDAPSKRAHRCRSQPRPNRRLTVRHPTRQLQHFPLQPPEPRMDTADFANGVPRGT